MTTTGEPEITSTKEVVISLTSTSAMTSPSQSVMEFYFSCAAIFIGALGTAANGLIIYALVASKQHQKNVGLLIFHQNAIDLSFFLVVIFSVKLCNIYLAGSVGYWLCTLLLSESLIWLGTCAAAINLASITIERYLKVVYHVWSKTKLRKWMLYAAMATAWIISFMTNIVAMFPTTAVIHGRCYAYMIWDSQAASMIYFFWYMMSYVVIITGIFIFCYWRILAVIRRQAKVMARGQSIAAGSSHVLNRVQTNVVKTMVIVSVFHAISRLPGAVSFVLMMLRVDATVFQIFFHVNQLLPQLYMCTNPFIYMYATKFDPVKEVLLRMIPCKKTSEQATSQTDRARGTVDQSTERNQ